MRLQIGLQVRFSEKYKWARQVMPQKTGERVAKSFCARRGFCFETEVLPVLQETGEWYHRPKGKPWVFIRLLDPAR